MPLDYLLDCTPKGCSYKEVIMQMGGWKDYLHFTFRGEHVLFEILPLNGYGNFFLGSVLTALLCLLER